MKKPFTVGITGGIAGGKSVVSGILEELGAYIIDTDVISREVIAPGTDGEKELRARFPEAYSGGTLDRKALRELVFADEKSREDLNDITHPLILNATIDKIKNSDRDVVFVVVPLMFEAGFDGLCDRVVTVACAEDVRIKRLMARNTSITEPLAREMIAAQMSDEVRIACSDDVIFNDGDLAELREKTVEYYQKIMSMER